MKNEKLLKVQHSILVASMLVAEGKNALQDVAAAKNKAGMLNDPIARAIAGAALLMYAESKLENLQKEEAHLLSIQPAPKSRAAKRR